MLKTETPIFIIAWEYLQSKAVCGHWLEVLLYNKSIIKYYLIKSLSTSTFLNLQINVHDTVALSSGTQNHH